MPGLSAESLTRPFVEQGFKLQEIRANYRISWKCVLKKPDDVSLTLVVSGTGPETIDGIDVAFLNFGDPKHDAEAANFFVQAARLGYHGPDAAEAVDWVRGNTGRNATKYFRAIQFEAGRGGNLQQLRIRQDPSRRFASERKSPPRASASLMDQPQPQAKP